MAQELQPQDTEQAEAGVEQTDDDRRERKNNPWPWVALIIVILIVLWLLWQYLGWADGERRALTDVKSTSDIVAPSGIPAQPTNTSVKPNPVQPVVPDVVGMAKGEAIAALQGAGFSPLVSELYGSKHPANTVFHQRPSAGAMLTEGGTVVIQVQQLRPSGATYSMPALIGLSRSRALRRLSAMGIKPTISYYPVVGAGEDDTVQSQWPLAGRPVRSGGEVQIQIRVRP